MRVPDTQAPPPPDTNECSVRVVFGAACPFCKEDGFDLVGLKGHLEHNDCEEYTKLMAPRRNFR